MIKHQNKAEKDMGLRYLTQLAKSYPSQQAAAAQQTAKCRFQRHVSLYRGGIFLCDGVRCGNQLYACLLCQRIKRSEKRLGRQ